MTGYPIIKQAHLREPARRGIRSLARPRRPDGEIPPIDPHEVLVYRVGGQFIVDDGRRRPDDHHVINATSVSVVNMQTDASVTATFSIDSQDASTFTIHANFVCTVLDPVVVVRTGQSDASEALLAYLKGYQPLFELGLSHRISDLNAVRREASIHIKAYITIKPPELAGISVHLANVQVETPETTAKFEEQLREDARQRELALREDARQREIALRAHATEAELKAVRQYTEKLLSAQGQTQDLAQAQELSEAIGDDPAKALVYAQVQGQLSAIDYADRLLHQLQEQQQLARDAAERERVQRERIADFKREIKLKKLGWKREDIVREIEHAHSAAERAAAEAADRRKEALAIELEILREFNKRGLLDNYYPDIEDLIRRIRGDHEDAERREVGDRAKVAAALPEGPGTDDEPDQDDEGLMTEEDYEY
jgi:hypothetical protein